MSPTPDLQPNAIAGLTLRQLAERTASKSPTPGGGSVAAVAGTLAAALAQMVVNFSIDKPDQAEHHDTNTQILADLSRATNLFLALADEDAAAYAEYSRLSKLPKDDPERTEYLPQAAAACATVPLAIANAAVETLRHIAPLAGRSNPWLRSDLAIAASLAKVAADAAHWNVLANLPTLRRLGIEGNAEHNADTAREHAAELAQRIDAACRQGW